jgi:hypothetical protein
VFGEPIGIDETAQLSTMGPSHRLIWKDGRVEHVDLYLNGEHIHYKEFNFDAQGRVTANRMYSPDGSGGWHLAHDVWYYTYDENTGRRAKKFIKPPHGTLGRELLYDEHGNIVEERVITVDGNPTDAYGYARKTFDNADGHAVREKVFNSIGELIEVNERVDRSP